MAMRIFAGSATEQLVDGGSTCWGPLSEAPQDIDVPPEWRWLRDRTHAPVERSICYRGVGLIGSAYKTILS